MQWFRTRRGQRLVAVSLVVLALVLGGAGAALAAQMEEGEVYRLAAGEVVADDLYVSAGEIYIDGTVEGDLVAFGGYIEVNGEVTGDLISSGGGIVVNGKVGDDVRAAGAGIRINGSVGDDLLVAGGGTAPGAPPFPMQIDGRQIEQGVWVSSDATVGGDAYLVGGTGGNGRQGRREFVHGHEPSHLERRCGRRCAALWEYHRRQSRRHGGRHVDLYGLTNRLPCPKGWRRQSSRKRRLWRRQPLSQP